MEKQAPKIRFWGVFLLAISNLEYTYVKTALNPTLFTAKNDKKPWFLCTFVRAFAALCRSLSKRVEPCRTIPLANATVYGI